MTMLDGNAVAGELSELFRLDMTMAIATCAGCATTGELARVRVFASEMGTVLRCPECDTLLARMAHTPGQLWMEMPGIRALRVRV
jgi:hypothetical protein